MHNSNAFSIYLAVCFASILGMSSLIAEDDGLQVGGRIGPYTTIVPQAATDGGQIVIRILEENDFAHKLPRSVREVEVSITSGSSALAVGQALIDAFVPTENGAFWLSKDRGLLAIYGSISDVDFIAYGDWPWAPRGLPGLRARRGNDPTEIILTWDESGDQTLLQYANGLDGAWIEISDEVGEGGENSTTFEFMLSSAFGPVDEPAMVCLAIRSWSVDKEGNQLLPSAWQRVYIESATIIEPSDGPRPLTMRGIQHWNMTDSNEPAALVALVRGHAVQHLTAVKSGGLNPITFRLAEGHALPKGLKLDSASGMIYGEASELGVSQVVIEVEDALGALAHGTVEFSIVE